MISTAVGWILSLTGMLLVAWSFGTIVLSDGVPGWIPASLFLSWVTLDTFFYVFHKRLKRECGHG